MLVFNLGVRQLIEVNEVKLRLGKITFKLEVTKIKNNIIKVTEVKVRIT